MSTVLTGEITIHKSDGVTRDAEATAENTSGSLSVWDEIPFGFVKIVYPDGSSTPLLIDERTSQIIEPDIVVKDDKWERVQRKGKYWKRSSTSAVIERAKERDDVDEEQVKDAIN